MFPQLFWKLSFDIKMSSWLRLSKPCENLSLASSCSYFEGIQQLTRDRCQQRGLDRHRIRVSSLCPLSHRPAPLMVQSFSYTAAIVTPPILYTDINKTHCPIELQLIPCRPQPQMLLCVIEHSHSPAGTFFLCLSSSHVCFSGRLLYYFGTEATGGFNATLLVFRLGTFCLWIHSFDTRVDTWLNRLKLSNSGIFNILCGPLLNNKHEASDVRW